ncbi:M28 family peptidase [Micromonospora fiedleri]|uniref:M28 family peptidase n=1 Tax=Micromonospora fiedleri TaxID=1157498 RepID=A0ABS1UFS1_9ACTN|nr:M28 family peptidase [Micromonospora fiedleri]
MTPSHESSNPIGSGFLNRRRVLTVALGGAATVALPVPAWAADGQRPGSHQAPKLTSDDRKVIAQISSRRALEHLVQLSEGIGPRIGGTESERRAADYIAAHFDKLGYDTTLQPFTVADKFTGQISAQGRSLPTDLNWQTGASAHAALNTSATGAVVDVRAGAASDYPADVRGKIVLVDYVAARREQVVATAVAAGAAGVILLAADAAPPRLAGTFSPTLPGSANSPVPIPVLGVAQSQKHRLRELLAAGPLTLTVATTAHRNLTSNNVLAERQGRSGANGPIVMISAHYDTVIGAPGANDDGSGTALCMELGRVLKAIPTNATIRFGLWGSEEQGLIGSRYYVRQMPQAERDRILAVYQNDMVATSWDPATKYWLLSFDGQDNRATSEVAAAARRLGYEPQISPVTQRGSSDHQSFQEVGIASANFSWRGEESPALLEPPYHTPEDTIAKNISLERLQVSMELIGTAAYATARA